MSVNEFFTAVSSDILATVSPLNSTDNKVGMNRKYETMKYSNEGERERERGRIKRERGLPFHELIYCTT